MATLGGAGWLLSRVRCGWQVEDLKGLIIEKESEAMNKIAPKNKTFVERMFNDLDDLHKGSDEGKARTHRHGHRY